MTGLLLVLFGAVAAVLGLGGMISFKGTVFGQKFETTSTGLVFLIVGAGMATIAATKKPRDVQLFAEGRPSFGDVMLANLPKIGFGLTVIGVILLAMSLYFRR